MAEQNDGQEKNEQPTQKRLDDARGKGQIARSRELSTMMILIGGALTLWLSGGHLLQGISSIMRANFTVAHADIFNGHLVMQRFNEHIIDALNALAPVLVASAAIAIFAPLALGGWAMSGKALAPKMERIDPIKGLKRVFGPKGLMELFKALIKFFLILGFSMIALHIEQDAVLNLSRGDVLTGLSISGDILFFTFVVASLATVVVALFDVPFQLWQHDKQLRMSRQEIKDELKETDGSPELKGRIRAMQQEVARRRMMAEVPNADVIVTNPEHYAVALRFDPQTMRAPVVLAKGVDEVAANIREVATEHRIATVAAPPLARAIFHTTRIGQEIPAGLYIAVARVLAYVFQLRDGVADVEKPTDLPIPADMTY